MLHFAYGITREEPCVGNFETCGDDIVVISVRVGCGACAWDVTDGIAEAR